MDDERYPQPPRFHRMRGPVRTGGTSPADRKYMLNLLEEQKARTRNLIEVNYTPLEIEIYRVRLCDHCGHEFPIPSASTCRLALLPVTLDGGDCPYYQEGRPEETKKEPGGGEATNVSSQE